MWPGGSLNAFPSVGVLDDELAAVIFLRPGEEERGRKIGADADRCAGNLTNRVIDIACRTTGRPVYRLKSGGKTCCGSAAVKKSWLRPSAFMIISPS